MTTTWLIRVHTNLSLVCGRQDNSTDLSDVVRSVRGQCPRANLLAIIGLRWLGVTRAHKVLTVDDADDTLFFDEASIASAGTVHNRVRQLQEFVEEPTIDMLDMWSTAMLQTYDYTRACNQSLETPTIRCNCVGEGCGTELYAGRFGWSKDCEDSKWLNFTARMACNRK